MVQHLHIISSILPFPHSIGSASRGRVWGLGLGEYNPNTQLLILYLALQLGALERGRVWGLGSSYFDIALTLSLSLSLSLLLSFSTSFSLPILFILFILSILSIIFILFAHSIKSVRTGTTDGSWGLREYYAVDCINYSFSCFFSFFSLTLSYYLSSSLSLSIYLIYCSIQSTPFRSSIASARGEDNGPGLGVSFQHAIVNTPYIHIHVTGTAAVTVTVNININTHIIIFLSFFLFVLSFFLSFFLLSLFLSLFLLISSFSNTQLRVLGPGRVWGLGAWRV